MGAFPCIYIVLAYLGAGWNRTTPLQADVAMQCVCEAQLPWRIQNVESRSRGAPPLLPQPAAGCKPPTAAGKLFGSSSAVGIAATPHRTRHRPRRRVCWCPGHSGKAGTSAHGGLRLCYLGNASGVFPPHFSQECKFHRHFLEPFTQGPKRMYERVRARTLALGHQLEKTNRKWEITELAACCGCSELLKQHFPASAPLLSAQDLIQPGLHTVQIFVFNSRSFSFAFLRDFLSNAAYVYFLFPSQCLPSPTAVFFLL